MIKKLLIIFAVIFSGVALAPTTVQAASPVSQVAVCGQGAGNIFGIQPWYACLKQKTAEREHVSYAAAEPKITAINDVFYILFPLVESLVKIGAYVAIFVIFFMLMKMVTARGNAGQIASAGNGIRDAIIGLIICVSAVAIVNFIASRFI